MNKTSEWSAADLNLSYLADEEEVLKDGAVHFHHHDVLVGVDIEEFLGLQLAGLHHHDHLSLNLVERRGLGHELEGVGARLVDEDEHLVVVAVEFLQRVPIRQTVDG